LWCVAQQLGGNAHKFVEQMAVEQRRRMQRLLELVTKDPERAEKALADIEKKKVGR
jgi:hypothetical protein